MQTEGADGIEDARRTDWVGAVHVVHAFEALQLRGLGRSERAEFFGLDGSKEAAAYHAHPVLGPRLRRCFALVLAAPTRDPVAMFGHVDAMKLRSSATLFDTVEPESLYRVVLDHLFHGASDAATLARL